MHAEVKEELRVRRLQIEDRWNAKSGPLALPFAFLEEYNGGKIRNSDITKGDINL